jgi:hypothetical protein
MGDPFTPPRRTSSHTFSTSLSEEEIARTSRLLTHIVPQGDKSIADADILDLVWTSVSKTLKKDPERGKYLASEDQFKENIKRKGEGAFVSSLKDMATSGSWRDLPHDGVYFISSDMKCSDHPVSTI